MEKKLEILLGDFFSKSSEDGTWLRVTNIVHIDENKSEKFWKKTIGISVGAAKIEIEYDLANHLSHLLEMTKFALKDPISSISFGNLVEIPDWLYYNESDGCWCEKLPEDDDGCWIKYKDYLAKEKR